MSSVVPRLRAFSVPRTGARLPRSRPAAGAVLAAVCVAVLCACGNHSGDNGVASETPARAMERVEGVARNAATVHVTGSVAGPGRPLGIDMELVRGQGGRGTVSTGGLRAGLVQDAGWIYVKPNPALLEQLVGPAAASPLAGRWLKGPADHGPLAPLASLTDLRTVLHQVLVSRPGLKMAGTRTIARHRAFGLRDPATGATLYVSSTGNPYPLALVKPGRNGGTLRFDRWNQAISLEAPPNPLNIKAVFSLKGL